MQTKENSKALADELYKAAARAIGRICKADGVDVSLHERGLLADTLLAPILKFGK